MRREPRMGRILPAAVLALVLSAAVTAHAGWDPPGWRKPQLQKENLPTSPAAFPALWGVRFFRSFISPVDGDRCPSYPTCSAYALEALGQHGFLVGTLLTAGRLVAEADEAAFAPRIRVGGAWKVYAPVETDLAFLRGHLAP